MGEAMDWIALAFYAAVCGTLGIFAPRLGGLPWRLGIGALVGIVAASVLPVLRAMVSY